jgi:uncharacterized protein (TIGR03083 family)
VDYDLGAVYRTARERLVELAPSLTATQLATKVPTCPAWTVGDTYAHLTGLAADVVGGGVESPGSDAATARQVGDRRGRPIDELCAEWTTLGPAMERILDERGRSLTRLAIDAWSHDQDIHNALDIVSGRNGPGLELTMSGIWRLKRVIRESGLAPFRVVTEMTDWIIGDEAPAATVRLPAYELARMATARRSVPQMRAYGWEGDPEPYIALIPIFPPPAVDIVE